jgi:hypothetical protein
MDEEHSNAPDKRARRDYVQKRLEMLQEDERQLISFEKDNCIEVGGCTYYSRCGNGWCPTYPRMRHRVWCCDQLNKTCHDNAVRVVFALCFSNLPPSSWYGTVVAGICCQDSREQCMSLIVRMMYACMLQYLCCWHHQRRQRNLVWCMLVNV